jgi:hypothetical protein
LAQPQLPEDPTALYTAVKVVGPGCKPLTK